MLLTKQSSSSFVLNIALIQQKIFKFAEMIGRQKYS